MEPQMVHVFERFGQVELWTRVSSGVASTPGVALVWLQRNASFGSYELAQGHRSNLPEQVVSWSAKKKKEPPPKKFLAVIQLQFKS